MKKCDQCDSATINGVYCHEFGCPNKARDLMRKKMEEFTEDWEETIDTELEEENDAL